MHTLWVTHCTHCSVVYKRLASLIADKKKQPYHLAINLIRCQLSFALIRSDIRCLRGYHSSPGLPRSPFTIEDIQLVSAESQIDIGSSYFADRPRGRGPIQKDREAISADYTPNVRTLGHESA